MDVLLLVGVLAVQPAVDAPEETEPTAIEPTKTDADVAESAEPSDVAETPRTAEPDFEAAKTEEADETETPPSTIEPWSEEGEPAPHTTRPPPPSPLAPQARDSEPTPIEGRRYRAPDKDDEEEESWQREGAFISLSVGAGHCGVWCSHLQAIGGGRFESGYRWGHFALGGSVSLLAGTFDTPPTDDDPLIETFDAKGSNRFFHIGPMMQFFFASAGRFDPYLSAGVGYRRVLDIAKIDGQSGDVRYWESGVGVALGGGVPVFVTERLTIGARYDKTFALGGKECITVDEEVPEGRSRCESWSKRTGELNTIDKRFVRLTRARPWTFSVEMRIAF